MMTRHHLTRPSSARPLRVCRRTFLIACLAIAPVTTAVAQSRPEIFKARLSRLGVTNATASTITGLGSVTATLTGSTLAIEAAFEGLTGVATAANLRRGPRGIPGPIVFDLEFPKASSGKISATLDLKPEQIVDLRAGRLYLQIHSERAPDGSIRGWLLKPREGAIAQD